MCTMWRDSSDPANKNTHMFDWDARTLPSEAARTCPSADGWGQPEVNNCEDWPSVHEGAYARTIFKLCE